MSNNLHEEMTPSQSLSWRRRHYRQKKNESGYDDEKKRIVQSIIKTACNG